MNRTTKMVGAGIAPLTVYPPVGGTINALAQNAGFAVAAGKSVLLVAESGTQFSTLLNT